jgi:hypothetical protein
VTTDPHPTGVAARLGPDQVYECHTAVVADHRVPADMAAGRVATRETLIERVGVRRASHIWWTDYTDTTAHEALRTIFDEGDRPPSDVATLDQMTAWLRQPHSVLIIAWCTATAVRV